MDNITNTQKHGSASCWRCLRNLDSKISGQFIVKQLSLDGFANVLYVVSRGVWEGTLTGACM